MHLQLVVNNDSPKALPEATIGTPSECLSVAEKRAIRGAVMSLELLPGVTVAAATAEYTELVKFIDFAASAEGVAADEDEVFESQLRVARLSTQAGLFGLVFHRNPTPDEGGARKVVAIVVQPRRLLKVAPSLKPYKDKLYMLSLQ